MITHIDSIFYYEHSDDFFTYESISGFRSLEIAYRSMTTCLSSDIHIDFAPTDFSINIIGSERVSEYAKVHLLSLTETGKDSAINSPRYFVINYCDGTKKYYEYSECFHELFNIAKSYEPQEEPKKQPFDDELMARITADMLARERATNIDQRATGSASPPQNNKSEAKIITVVVFLFIICIVCIFTYLFR